jgi:hypothetical protein
MPKACPASISVNCSNIAAHLQRNTFAAGFCVSSPKVLRHGSCRFDRATG